jgi:hypothetical protein
MTDDPTGGADIAGAPSDAGAGAPSEAELRAAYEAELARISATDMILQATVSLLNIAAHRLGPTGGPPVPGAEGPAGAEAAGAEGDLEQVRDGIDAVRALLEILERRIPAEVRPLRDGLSQLQLAYARRAQAAGGDPAPGPGGSARAPAGPPGGRAGTPPPGAGEPQDGQTPGGPGPAQSSGRLWVPGR